MKIKMNIRIEKMFTYHIERFQSRVNLVTHRINDCHVEIAYGFRCVRIFREPFLCHQPRVIQFFKN
jgi:hypothetical protein